MQLWRVNFDLHMSSPTPGDAVSDAVDGLREAIEQRENATKVKIAALTDRVLHLESRLFELEGGSSASLGVVQSNPVVGGASQKRKKMEC